MALDTGGENYLARIFGQRNFVQINKLESLNPARAFGPYLVYGDFSNYWIYLAGPIIGMLLGARLILLWRETKNPLFSHCVEQTAQWMIREMTSDGGEFASSIAADSEGYREGDQETESGEGAFYIWTETVWRLRRWQKRGSPSIDRNGLMQQLPPGILCRIK